MSDQPIPYVEECPHCGARLLADGTWTGPRQETGYCCQCGGVDEEKRRLRDWARRWKADAKKWRMSEGVAVQTCGCISKTAIEAIAAFTARVEELESELARLRQNQTVATKALQDILGSKHPGAGFCRDVARDALAFMNGGDEEVVHEN